MKLGTSMALEKNANTPEYLESRNLE